MEINQRADGLFDVVETRVLWSVISKDGLMKEIADLETELARKREMLSKMQ